MRIKCKIKRPGCYRVKHKFFLFPKKIDDSTIVWLERVYVVERLTRNSIWSFHSVTNIYGYNNFKQYLKSKNKYPDFYSYIDPGVTY